MKKVAIVGAGLAGLISSIELCKKGVPCVLFEKKKFPFHRVCGEYISNEALPYLKSLDLYPESIGPSTITELVLSSARGQTATMPLDLGGFGVSRFHFDHFLRNKAIECGVEVKEATEVTGVEMVDDKFVVSTSENEHEADVVIGAFGKRSRLDLEWERNFISERSPYVGVKYHVRMSHPENVIALHSFPGGYCGVVNVENGITNICYLASRGHLQKLRSIRMLEEEMLSRNPLLKKILSDAVHLWQAPVVINEISFATKFPVERNILMVGDAAGMIAPLCGNGMAIAVHTGKIAAERVLLFCQNRISRKKLEGEYAEAWSRTFAGRLRTGRIVQQLFRNPALSNAAVSMMSGSATLANIIMKRTHGQVF